MAQAPTHDQIRRGVQRLLAAIDGTEEPVKHSLDEALEIAHVSADRWQDCIDQLENCRLLTRRQLGLTKSGEDGYDELPDGSTVKKTAEGMRTFLRRMSCLITEARDIQILASELHAIVYGPSAPFAPITWRDYMTVLEGRSDGPDVWEVRHVAALLRNGHRAEEVQAATGLSPRQVKGVSTFLGLKDWRAESKARAARVAVANGWSVAEFVAEYNLKAAGIDELGERNARHYMAAVQGRETHQTRSRENLTARAAGA